MTEQSRCCGSFAESRAARSRLRFFEHLVHSGGFGFPGMLADVEHPDAQLARAEGDFDYVAHFDVVRRFDNPAVYGNMFVVAGFVCDSPALYEPGHFKKFVNSHVYVQNADFDGTFGEGGKAVSPSPDAKL